jgi:8-oxo-dGTP pyrophosphatase MutT (NUDIX family)
MNHTTGLSDYIRTAVLLKDFDARDSRIAMSPVGRIPERPAGLSGTARSGAVLIVLFSKSDALHVILIKRRDNLRHHPGQISFPGGRREQGETPLACALRETSEEIGIAPDALSIIGPLEPAYIIVSDFCVYPFIAWHPGLPECSIDPCEVDTVLLTPLACLSTPNARMSRSMTILGTRRSVPGFLVDGQYVWGATALLLNELIERLKTAGWNESYNCAGANQR